MSSRACRNSASVSLWMSRGTARPVDGDRELLARQVGRADLRSISDVAEAHRIRCRAEVESATKEDAVNRADDRSPIGGDGRQGQQAHPGQTVSNLVGSQPPFRGDDAEQVPPGGREAAVEQVLQGGQVRRRLAHLNIEPAACARRSGAGVITFGVP